VGVGYGKGCWVGYEELGAVPDPNKISGVSDPLEMVHAGVLSYRFRLSSGGGYSAHAENGVVGLSSHTLTAASRTNLYGVTRSVVVVCPSVRLSVCHTHNSVMY